MLLAIFLALPLLHLLAFHPAVDAQIRSSADLNCTFSSPCLWQNETHSPSVGFLVVSDAIPDQRFPVGDGPDENYFAYTIGPSGFMGQASLLSEIVECQLGGAKLKFWHFHSGHRSRVDVCLRYPPGSPLPTAIHCYAPFGNVIGAQQWQLASVELPPMSQPMELLIRATFESPHSLVAIDNIVYEAILCETSHRGAAEGGGGAIDGISGGGWGGGSGNNNNQHQLQQQQYPPINHWIEGGEEEAAIGHIPSSSFSSSSFGKSGFYNNAAAGAATLSNRIGGITATAGNGANGNGGNPAALPTHPLLLLAASNNNQQQADLSGAIWPQKKRDDLKADFNGFDVDKSESKDGEQRKEEGQKTQEKLAKSALNGTFDCNFENSSFCAYENVPEGMANVGQWMLSNKSIANPLTGIQKDHSGDGWFLYAGSNADSASIYMFQSIHQIAQIPSAPSMFLSLQFHYHLAGARGRLRVCFANTTEELVGNGQMDGAEEGEEDEGRGMAIITRDGGLCPFQRDGWTELTKLPEEMDPREWRKGAVSVPIGSNKIFFYADKLPKNYFVGLDSIRLVEIEGGTAATQNGIDEY